jgi:hypothetical protein
LLKTKNIKNHAVTSVRFMIFCFQQQ